MKLKKKNDIERKSTKFYQLGRRKQYCFIYQFSVGRNKRQNVASLIYFVLYIQVYIRQVVIYIPKKCLLKDSNPSNWINHKVPIES